MRSLLERLESTEGDIDGALAKISRELKTTYGNRLKVIARPGMTGSQVQVTTYLTPADVAKNNAAMQVWISPIKDKWKARMIAGLFKFPTKNAPTLEAATAHVIKQFKKRSREYLTRPAWMDVPLPKPGEDRFAYAKRKR